MQSLTFKSSCWEHDFWRILKTWSTYVLNSQCWCRSLWNLELKNVRTCIPTAQVKISKHLQSREIVLLRLEKAGSCNPFAASKRSSRLSDCVHWSGVDLSSVEVGENTCKAAFHDCIGPEKKYTEFSKNPAHLRSFGRRCSWWIVRHTMNSLWSN